MTPPQQQHRAAHASAPARDALASLVPLLACPACKRPDAALAARAEQLVCSSCKALFPIYKSGAARIPWLFRDPEAARLEWRSRYQGFLHASSAEQTRLEQALGETRRRKSAAARIGALLEARAAQRKEVVELLGPLALGAVRAHPSLDRTGALHARLPARRDRAMATELLFRDWSWDNLESESLVESVRHVAQGNPKLGSPTLEAGKMLTLGAGACRLSHDLHRLCAAQLSVALDVNPMLLFAASRVLHGERITLHEFPDAPLNKASGAVARACAAPDPLPAGDASFMFVLADALNAPFKPGSFDTVLTPWLVDAGPWTFVDCARAVNRLLREGGTWIDLGPLAFAHRNEAWCHSEEEIPELLAANGFEVVATERRAVPYLQSPASAHGRIERALAFRARKTAAAEPPNPAELLPAWLLDAARPVPDLDELVVASAHRLLQAQIFGAVDGQRSIDDIVQLVTKRYGLQRSEAEGTVRRTLLEAYEAMLGERVTPESFLG